MQFSDIPRPQTRDALVRLGITENDLELFENIEQIQRYIYLENRKRSNAKKGVEYFKKYYEDNREKLCEMSRIYKQKKKMDKIEQSIVKKI